MIAPLGSLAFLLIALGIAVWFQWTKVVEVPDAPFREDDEVAWLESCWSLPEFIR